MHTCLRPENPGCADSFLSSIVVFGRSRDPDDLERVRMFLYDCLETPFCRQNAVEQVLPVLLSSNPDPHSERGVSDEDGEGEENWFFEELDDDDEYFDDLDQEDDNRDGDLTMRKRQPGDLDNRGGVLAVHKRQLDDGTRVIELVLDLVKRFVRARTSTT